LRHVGEWWT